MADFTNVQGNWVTIRGTPIFIKEGQDISDAFKEALPRLRKTESNIPAYNKKRGENENEEAYQKRRKKERKQMREFLKSEISDISTQQQQQQQQTQTQTQTQTQQQTQTQTINDESNQYLQTLKKNHAQRFQDFFPGLDINSTQEQIKEYIMKSYDKDINEITNSSSSTKRYANPEKVKQKVTEEIKTFLDRVTIMTPEELVKVAEKITKATNNFLKKAEVHIQLIPGVLESVLQNGYKAGSKGSATSVTGQSASAWKQRKGFENRLGGNKYVYGLLSDPDSSIRPNFGNVTLVLDDSVKENATFTLDDSIGGNTFSSSQAVYPLQSKQFTTDELFTSSGTVYADPTGYERLTCVNPVYLSQNEPGEEGYNGTFVCYNREKVSPMAYDSKYVERYLNEDLTNLLNTRYFEVQIPGRKIGPDKIKKIVFQKDPNLEGRHLIEHEADLQKVKFMAEQYGIPFEVKEVKD